MCTRLDANLPSIKGRWLPWSIPIRPRSRCTASRWRPQAPTCRTTVVSSSRLSTIGYRLVQELNRLQAEKLRFAGDRSSRDSRISHAHWHNFAEFRYEAALPIDALRTPRQPLLPWLATQCGSVAGPDALDDLGGLQMFRMLVWIPKPGRRDAYIPTRTPSTSRNSSPPAW